MHQFTLLAGGRQIGHTAEKTQPVLKVNSRLSSAMARSCFVKSLIPKATMYPGLSGQNIPKQNT